MQGFGFLRTYFGPVAQPKRFRLNLWDSSFTVPNVSTIHDHPWSFDSIVIAGQFCNQRYVMGPMSPGSARHFSYMTIKTGEGGGVERGDTKVCALCALAPKTAEFYGPGDTYHQESCEIHETKFEDGSVTLNERIGDTEHARVFWPYGADWVDAKPRSATYEEITRTVSNSLERWFQ